MPEISETLKLRIELGELRYLNRLCAICTDLEQAYAGIYYFLGATAELRDYYQTYRKFLNDFPPFGPLFPFELGRIEQRKGPYTEYVHPLDRLVLARCKIESPGIIEVIGKLNPLEVLRQWMHDHHERRKDREYRERAEQKRLDLENEILETQLIRERIELLQKAGVPQHIINNVINCSLVACVRPLALDLTDGSVMGIEAVSGEKTPKTDSE